MDNTFDVDKFIARIGTRLVEQFEDARAATSPAAVGDAMEQPVKDQLEQLLPRGIGVGSGFVIDSNGATSRQTDVVLYEKDICPIFSINNTPGTTYYPCEGVIAVGQVKSLLTKSLLKEEFGKIASVKRLQRYSVHDFMPHPTTGAPLSLERSYGNMQTPSLIDVSEKSKSDETRQILGFIIAGSVRMQTDTLMEAFLEFTRDTGEHLSPSIAVILSGGMLTWGKITTRRTERTEPNKTGTYGMSERHDGPPRWEPSWSAQNAEILRYLENTEPFRTLIQYIYEMYRTGKTSDVRAFNRYLLESDSSASDQPMLMPKNGMTLEEYLNSKNLNLSP